MVPSQEQEAAMERLSNRRTILTLVVVAFITAGALDHHAEWNDPRQAVADIAWIGFILCASTCVVLGVRAAIVYRRPPAA
jgi:hypothetical protein